MYAFRCTYPDQGFQRLIQLLYDRRIAVRTYDWRLTLQDQMLSKRDATTTFGDRIHQVRIGVSRNELFVESLSLGLNRVKDIVHNERLTGQAMEPFIKIHHR
jgi:hypothetical protein